MYRFKKKNPSQKDRQKKLAHLLAKTVTDEDGCMIWQGYSHRGNGIATVFGFTESVNRHIYRLAKGRITKNQKVLRSCNKKLCGNPDHLITGDVKQLAKIISIQSGHARTLRANLSIVTNEIRDKVLELAKTNTPYRDIANQFNITRHRVSAIALSNGIRRNKSHVKNGCEIDKAGKKEKDICSGSKVKRKKPSETCCQENLRIAQ